ncbi:MAG: cysteine hydrolase [Candidatus Scalindua sp. AMX11]|nr:MAG: cysteine hydrolase [Candidatus Scalindua sp.]NOG83310.1 cysteine hydrolase [Planctomycetota bacterium]RZV76790.1 MAG: cysteine hydrolase [Candidatus Scalindua sp. SCAELEC01]TDE63456.1 MAG: cysteine hydrolase [Candidatus Scalindua sp. AMX11]GJQ57474.1 MAG: nicotinamidase [Candidatus Scalindua sp.]
MDPRGNLYVPHAVDIRDNLKKLFTFAKEHEIKILSSIDAHTVGDEEFQHFPPHCVKETEGVQKIDITKCKDSVVIENIKQPITRSLLNRQQIIVEKQSLDIFDNVNTDNIVRSLNIECCVVFGVATDYCVKAAALGLHKRKYTVYLVTDAVKPFTSVGEKVALDTLRSAGTIFISTDAVLEEDYQQRFK